MPGSDAPRGTGKWIERGRLEGLSVREVLALAIHVEQANARRFRAFAESFRGYDEEVARRFDELAVEEDDHEWRLVDQFRRSFGESIPPVDEATVGAVIESVDLDDGEHQVFDSLSPRRVYELALAAERAAKGFYLEAARHCRDGRLAALFSELAALEDGHVGWVEERLRKLEEAAG